MMTNQRKKFISLTLIVILILSTIVPVTSAATPTFSDIAGNDHEENIEAVAALGLISGYSDNTFRPGNDVTRGQVALILGQWAEKNGIRAPIDYLTTDYFTDIPKRATDDNKKYYALVKNSGIFAGYSDGSLKPAKKMNRQQMAVVLNAAYKEIFGISLVEIAGDTSTVVVNDIEEVNSDYRDEVLALKKLGITAVSNFNPDGVVTRGQFTSFLNATINVTSVEAINSTTVKVKFGQAIDSDFIREAERSGEFFAIYKEGETIRGNIIQSKSTHFSKDGKTAEFVLKDTIQSGEKFYVVLLDGPNASVANIVQKFSPTVLRGAATQPDFEVSAVSDKITLRFSTKMKNSALAVDHYEVYDEGGQLIGPLSEFVITSEGGNGDWVNAITKREVEFTLNPDPEAQKLLADRTYKIKLKEDIETDDNKTLSKDQLVILVKTPAIDEVAPKVAMARVTSANEIDLVFDKDVEGLHFAGLHNLVEIQTATGKTVVTKNITGAIGDAPNEVTLTLTYADDSTEALYQGISYNVSIPAYLVTNAVFPNATNKATSNIKATAQDSKEITSVTAKLVSDAKERTQGNLVLTFDQRPTLESVNNTLTSGKIIIFDGTDRYVSQGIVNGVTVKYAGVDTTGKSVIIEGINAAGAFKFGDHSFAPKSGESYTVEIAADTIEVDGFGTTNPKNQTKLKTTIIGVSVSAPAIDRIKLESAEKMVIEFKEAINSTVDLNKITVAGFEANLNKFYSAKNLTGSSYFTASVSDNKLTLTAKFGVKFATGAEGNGGTGNLISFAQHAVVSKDSSISIAAVAIAEGAATGGELGGVKFVDRAAPQLLFAKEGMTAHTDLLFIFTENIVFEGNVAPLFHTGGGTAKSSVGTIVSKPTNSTLNVTFRDAWNDGDTAFLEVTAEYRPGITSYITDSFGNRVLTTKVIGVERTE